MRKDFIVRTVALVVCLVFIGSMGSGLIAAEKRIVKTDFRLLWDRPIQFLISVFPSFSSIFATRGKQILSSENANLSSSVKPTGELTTGRPSVGD
jgi:hypothetical protein